jgi:precorrin-6x reductase
VSQERVEFLASFPNIQTAIRVAGDGGARILLDIPESELPAIMRLLLLRGMVVRVTVEPEVLETKEHTQVVDWREGKRRKVKK